MFDVQICTGTRLLFALIAALLPSVGLTQPTALNLDRGAGPARVWLNGEPGRDYTLESSDSLMSNSWQFRMTTRLTNGPQPWFDSESMLAPRRFYRAAKLAPVEPQPAANFRLVDHLGRSRELDYHLANPNVPAMVLLFTGNGCAKVGEMLASINSLSNRFGPNGVLFWMIDANTNDNRSNIVAEATALGINLPILHDRAQLVAHSYGATATPEALALRKQFFPDLGTTKWTVFYRGAIDDRLGSNAVATTQYYLSNALGNFLAGGPVTPGETRPAGCAITFTPPQANISYSADIAPLIQDKCARCHSPGNIAPFAFSDYSIVQGAATLIRDEVLANRMPPWHADYNFGVWTNDASLTPAQAAKLIQWIDAGAARGTGPDVLTNSAPPTNYPFVWPTALGQPSVVYSIPVQSIPDSGVIEYRYINVTNTLPTNVWLRAAVVLPGNAQVVHHSLVFSGTSGFLEGLDGFFSGYVPGFEGAAFPPGTGKLLKAGEVLRFQMHYISIGTPETDQTKIGLYIMPSPPTYALQTKSAYSLFFSIPPGNPDYQTTATSAQFAKNVYVYEFSPHMHLRGSRFKFEAVYPNSTREVLCSVPSFDFHWQHLYRLAQPKFLPAGTSIVCTGAWDNSPQNLENPDPADTVTFGEQTFDEMFIGYFNYAEIP